MYVLLIAAWLLSPIFPLNPTQQDTLNHVNIHLTAGISGPTRLSTPGPEFTIKYELMFHHPFVLRTAFDYRYGKMKSVLYSEGKFHGTIISAEIFYYKGTYKSTGYVGMGMVYVNNFIRPSQKVSESLYETDHIADIYMLGKLGYRITLGLRFHKNYSLELAITEVSPTLVTKTQLSENKYSNKYEKIRLNNVRFMLGYLIPLSW